MRSCRIVLASLLFVTLATSDAWSQVIMNNASTVAESRARGLADVVRAQGANNLANSAAAQNYATARSMEMDNRLKWTNTYFENKMANRAYRDKLRGPRATQEQLVRFARAGAPQPLSTSEVDPLTGKIRWPIALTAADFASDRESLEKIFAERAQQGGQINLDQWGEVRKITDEMLATLKSNIGQLTANTYVPAKRFIQSLAHAAQI